MHENEFRRRFRASLGEAPDELGAAQRAVAGLHRRAPADESGRHPRAFALVAIGLTLLVVAGLLGPRLVRTVRTGGSQTSPAAAGAPSPAPVPTPAPVSACRLPVIVTDSHATINPPADAQTDDLDVETAGFVEMATGRFQPDPAAVQDGMPFSRSYLKDVWRPQTDDPVLRRWLPVQPSQVAPDHGSYL